MNTIELTDFRHCETALKLRDLKQALYGVFTPSAQRREALIEHAPQLDQAIAREPWLRYPVRFNHA